jgi:hypothetical protein
VKKEDYLLNDARFNTKRLSAHRTTLAIFGPFFIDRLQEVLNVRVLD